MSILVERGGSSASVEVRAAAAADKVLRDFLNVDIGGRVVSSPFWMNYDKDWIDTQWYFSVPKGGKLSPTEIAEKTRLAADTSGCDLGCLTIAEMLCFMRDHGIGVDCSGLVYQLSEAMYKAAGGTDFSSRIIDVNGEHSGITRVNVACLTGPLNAVPVDQVDQCVVGDIIRCQSGHHSIIVVDVERLKGSLSLKCAHSSDGVPAKGVSVFEVRVVNPELNIFLQEWGEVSTIDGSPYNTRLVRKLGEGDGLYRLRVMNEIYSVNGNLGSVIDESRDRLEVH